MPPSPILPSTRYCASVSPGRSSSAPASTNSGMGLARVGSASAANRRSTFRRSGSSPPHASSRLRPRSLSGFLHGRAKHACDLGPTFRGHSSPLPKVPRAASLWPRPNRASRSGEKYSAPRRLPPPTTRRNIAFPRCGPAAGTLSLEPGQGGVHGEIFLPPLRSGAGSGLLRFGQARLRAPRRRAYCNRMRRMIWAAMATNCARFCQLARSCPARHR